MHKIQQKQMKTADMKWRHHLLEEGVNLHHLLTGTLRVGFQVSLVLQLELQS